MLSAAQRNAVATSKNLAITFVRVDGRRLPSPSLRVEVPPGHHHLSFAINFRLFGWTNVGAAPIEAPLDYSFKAGHHYTFDGILADSGQFTLRVTDETEQPRDATPVPEFPGQKVNIKMPREAAGSENTATYKFQLEVHSILNAGVGPEMAQHYHRLNGGPIKYEFWLDSRGHVTSAKATSTKGSRWGEQTLLHFIHQLKFPAVPKQVIEEEKRDGRDLPLKVYGEMDYTPQ